MPLGRITADRSCPGISELSQIHKFWPLLTLKCKPFRFPNPESRTMWETCNKSLIDYLLRFQRFLFSIFKSFMVLNVCRIQCLVIMASYLAHIDEITPLLSLLPIIRYLPHVLSPICGYLPCDTSCTSRTQSCIVFLHVLRMILPH